MFRGVILAHGSSNAGPCSRRIRVLYSRHSHEEITMPLPPKRRAVNGRRRRKPVRQVSPNERWLHLTAGAVSNQQTLQTCTVWAMAASTYCTLLTALGLCVQGTGLDSDAVKALVANAAITAASYCSVLHLFTDWDHLLHDIPPEHDRVPAMFKPLQHPTIDGLSDPKAIAMTGFTHGQLRRLYRCFNLEGYLAARDEVAIPLPTGHVNQRGVACRRLVPPEEAFLFLLAKVKTGRSDCSIVNEWFGGHYQQWSLVYHWLLLYVDRRYERIIGHQGLSRFVRQFPAFNEAIEAYLARDFNRQNLDSSWLTFDGLSFLPMDVFGFLDCTIDPVCQPFSGPRGDYDGAARKREWPEAQRALYTGYKKHHGIKMETLLLPNGLCTLFGPLSARRGDVGPNGLLGLGGVNDFLEAIQHGKFAANGRPVYYCALGDGAVNLGLKCIVSYYRRLNPAVPLTQHQELVNYYLKRARITIEKNYGAIGNEFLVCDTKRGKKLAKHAPHTCEQLRVCHLLLNCKICFNGDTVGSSNTFGAAPPSVEQYLAL